MDNKIVVKQFFLKTLPYICCNRKERKFISRLINKTFLNEEDQAELTEYFNVRNKHWTSWGGESNFRYWMLFTNPNSCLLYDKARLKKARIMAVPYMSKFMVGKMDKNVRKYAKHDRDFGVLFEKRITESSYYERNHIYYPNFLYKIWPAIRVKLYRYKFWRDFFNRFYYPDLKPSKKRLKKLGLTTDDVANIK